MWSILHFWYQTKQLQTRYQYSYIKQREHQINLGIKLFFSNT
ncbi:hypothetical protein ECDEC12C_0123 [Escherichia coli DEC12C]|nr:hypothetical protein ECDEC12C_0123 [Escherichia coli DEC12C]